MTEKPKSPQIRYNEGCLASHALNLIGDRWALLVVRELMFASKRFQRIRTGLHHRQRAERTAGATGAGGSGRSQPRAGRLCTDRFGAWAATGAGVAVPLGADGTRS